MFVSLFLKFFHVFIISILKEGVFLNLKNSLHFKYNHAYGLNNNSSQIEKLYLSVHLQQSYAAEKNLCMIYLNLST